MAETLTTVPEVQITRYEHLPRFLKFICLVLWTIGTGLFILYMFGWSIRGWVLEDIQYYYLLYTTFSTCVFLTMPMRKKDKTTIPWYDLVLAAFTFATCVYFVMNAWEIAHIIWMPPPSVLSLAFACIICLLALESGRRMAGLPFTVICVIMGAYPLFAEHMPGVLYGFSFPFDLVVGSFAYGKAGMLGLPAQVTGEILIGFLIFAGMLMASGAGTFFLNLALALLGRFRGGPAKVAVLASGFFGSLSGSSMANVVATGSVTIPAMKRMGYPPHYAGAIEAVASSGGAVMPPVMGAIAFIMAIITGIPYSVILIAAILPAILYYYGLLVQVDAYAARIGLMGLPREELPSLVKTLKQGWPFLVTLFFLVFGLLYMRWGALAPVYASGLMLILSFTNRQTMMTPRRIIEAVATIGSLITYMMAVLLPVGLIMLGIQLPGTLTALTAQIVSLASANVVLVLLIAVVVCYLFGMVGMALIPYIVLAVTAIPAMITATGFSLLGLHLFFIYYLLTGGITPPVAVVAFMGAAIAGGRPMKTGFTAMRLAVVLYFVPFFFVFNPPLILEGPISETLYLFALCLLGILILGSGLEGYLLKVGRLDLWSRPFLVAGGFLVAYPGLITTIIGTALTVFVIAIIIITKKPNKEKLTVIST
jgi:TRAP transporter 4TM/12TM fusion protein